MLVIWCFKMLGLYWIISYGCYSEKICFFLLVKKVVILGFFYFVLNNVLMFKIFGKLVIYFVDYIMLIGKIFGCNVDFWFYVKEIVYYYFGFVLVIN